MKFLELAEKVLKETLKPMSAFEIWNYASDKSYLNLLNSEGKTPRDTLSAQLYTAANSSSNKRFEFIGTRPKRFYLSGITPENALKDIDESSEFVDRKLGYKEKDLHQVLVSFVNYHYGAYSKTINHSRSSKKKYMQWSHPDIVAVSYPSLEWSDDTFELSSVLNQMPVKLLSFELKLQLNFGNLRESFFQAVSNSSWANEGYLVTANIQSDPEFMVELSRLSDSFGIGVIELDLHDFGQSDFFSHAKEKESLDWSTINNLASQNEDFKEFIRRVKKDLNAKEVREDWYDNIKTDDELAEYFKDRI